MKQINIAFCADGGYMPYVAVALQSIIENSSRVRNYNIHILEIGTGDAEKEKIARMMPANFSIEFINMDKYIKKYKFNEFWYSGRLNYSAYFRLFLPIIFPKMDKILYLDSDLVATRDVADLFNIDIGDNYLGASYDFYLHQPDINNRDGFQCALYEYLHKKLGMKNPAGNYFNSGVLLMNLDAMRHDKMTDKFVRLAKTNNAFYHDQNVLNAACENRVHYLNPEWNFMTSFLNHNKNIDWPTYDRYKEIARKRGFGIVHYCWIEKAWSHPRRRFSNIWWKYARHTPFYKGFVIAKWKRRLKRIFK